MKKDENLYCFSEDEQREILDIVRNNMSFDGSADGSFYDGSQDDFICFDGKPDASFNSEASAVYRQFTFVIKNDTDRIQEILLTPDYNYTPTYQDLVKMALGMNVPAQSINPNDPAAAVSIALGNMVSRGYLMDGKSFAVGETISTGAQNFVTCSSTSSTVQDFFAFIRSNPTNLIAMRISDNSNDDTQIAMSLEVTPKSPFKTLQSTPLYPSTNLDQNSFQKNVCMFNTTGIVLSDQTAIKYRIAPALDPKSPRIVNITMICGAVLNTAKALEKKTAKAAKNTKNLVQLIKEGKTIQ